MTRPFEVSRRVRRPDLHHPARHLGVLSGQRSEEHVPVPARVGLQKVEEKIVRVHHSSRGAGALVRSAVRDAVRQGALRTSAPAHTNMYTRVRVTSFVIHIRRGAKDAVDEV